MTAKRAFYVMIGMVCAVIIAIGAVLYFGNKLLVAESNKLLDLKATNEALENQENGLAKANRDIAKYKNLEEITQSIVPQDKDQARAVREIVTLAQSSGIKLKSITFPASNLGTKVTPPAGQNQENAQQPTTTTPTISQAKPVEGIKGVYSLEANIVPENTVSYYQFIDFLSKMEKNRRTAQVTNIKIDPKSSNRNNPALTFSLTVNIFLKP